MKNKSLDYRITEEKLLKYGYVESYKLCLWEIIRPDTILYGVEDWGTWSLFNKTFKSLEDAISEYVKRIPLSLKNFNSNANYYSKLRTNG